MGDFRENEYLFSRDLCKTEVVYVKLVKILVGEVRESLLVFSFYFGRWNRFRGLLRRFSFSFYIYSCFFKVYV